VPTNDLWQPQPTSSCASDVQQPSVTLLFPVPRRELSPYPRQQNLIRSGCTTPVQYRPATPRDVHDLTGQIIKDDKYISTYGGYGDIYKGSLCCGAKVCILNVLGAIHLKTFVQVAIKVLRPRSEADRPKMSKVVGNSV
jgi:hypothetical protein